MARVTETDSGRVLDDAREIAELLARHGMWYRRLSEVDRPPDGAAAEAVLAALSGPIAELSTEGGYVTADVIDVRPDTPGLAAMLARFNREHWHDEDEVRLIVGGRGVFHVRPSAGPVLKIEVCAGDMIKVPAGTRHWFDLCGERAIRAVRLFRDPAGWTPRYTESGAEAGHEPLCFGPRWLPWWPER
jgi:1,2-dihydroxy-3-keto-5-methylthiopentene dioxygenase